MHYSYLIDREGRDPRSVPGWPGVNINWVHRDEDGNYSREASINAAQAMVRAYGIVYRPAAPAASKHTEGLAVDMTITWENPRNTSFSVSVRNKNGQAIAVEIPAGGTYNAGMNRAVIEIGKTYGVIKLLSDPPHWSDDGH
jgi:hypothetical protein